MSPNGLNAIQSSATARPLLGRAPVSAAEGGVIDQGEGPAFLRFDLTDDSLPHVLASGLSGDLIVFGRNGSWIARDLSVTSGGSLEIGPNSTFDAIQGFMHAVGDIAGWVAVDRSLSAAEQAALISRFRLRGARGLLAPGPDLLTNGDFTDAATGWSLSGGWSISGGNATHSGPSGSDLTQTGVLSANTAYLVSYEIAEVRAASTLYVRVGAGGYVVVVNGMTTGAQSLVVRTGEDVLDGFKLRAGAGSDVDFTHVSLRELRPEEDW